MTLVEFLAPEQLASFLTLVFLEIVLAGDNLVLIAILAGRLPENQRAIARRFGLLAAVFTRLALLFSLFWLSHLETPIPIAANLVLTPRQIVLGIGGLFLVLKSVSEILSFFANQGPTSRRGQTRTLPGAFFLTIVQIAFFDLVFSLDSVVAAIGLARHVEIMAAAIIVAAVAMLVLVNPISNFIDSHPTVKLIALNFLGLVGALLIAEAFGVEFDRIWFYLALALAILVQLVLFWLFARSNSVRYAAYGLTLALVAILVVGAIQHDSHQPSLFSNFYEKSLDFLYRAIDLVNAFITWVRPWFAMR